MTRMVLIGLALAAVSTPSAAAERARAQVGCEATGEKLVYRCMAMLTGRKSGKPVSGAVVQASADMPSMAMAHNVRPVRLKPAGKPGLYSFTMKLEMYGLWAVKLKMSKPTPDIIIARLRFTKDGASPPGKNKGRGTVKPNGQETN